MALKQLTFGMDIDDRICRDAGRAFADVLIENDYSESDIDRIEAQLQPQGSAYIYYLTAFLKDGRIFSYWTTIDPW